MSIELTLKIWTSENLHPRERVVRLVEALGSYVTTSQPWLGVTIKSIKSSKPILQTENTLSTDELFRILSEYPTSGLHISARTFIQCWRFNGLNAVDGFVPLWIEAWDAQYSKMQGWCREVEGDASITLADSGPFIALLRADDNPKAKDVNVRVEENLNRLMNIIFGIIERLDPMSIKVYTASCLYNPLNAHLIYFKDASSIVNDLYFIKELWYQGLDNYKTGPLKECFKNVDTYAWHSWRATEVIQKICSILEEVIELSDMVDIKDILDINWSLYDNYELLTGRIVLDYPYWINSFVDHFYTSVLQNKAIKMQR